MVRMFEYTVVVYVHIHLLLYIYVELWCLNDNGLVLDSETYIHRALICVLCFYALWHSYINNLGSVLLHSYMDYKPIRQSVDRNVRIA